MRALKVLNNNVVLVQDGDDVVIVTGRGIGYQVRPGAPIDQGAIQRIFAPCSEDDTLTLARLLADIPANHIVLVDRALERVAREHPAARRARESVSATVALADHVSFAIARVRSGVTVTYPLRSEIAHLYPEELAAADRLVAELSALIGDVDLPAGEAVAIALHLVNASFSSTDLTHTYELTDAIIQVFDVIEQFYGRPVDRDGLTAARFTAHMRYFFVRLARAEQFDESDVRMSALITEAYPEAHRCAMLVKTLLEAWLETEISPAEIAYLALHIERFSEKDDRGETAQAHEAAKQRGYADPTQ
nr:PRD domain-containing protein [Nanchangia anserum]